MSKTDLSDMVLNTETAVRERYSAAAGEREAQLCCPVDYDAQYLKVIPDEVIERDYGCGDPSKYVQEGETVLDLGSGGGKICFIASQKVGPNGKVIGVDMNDDMLSLARWAQPVVAEKIGYCNVEFVKAKIQDMAIDRDRVDAYLKSHPVGGEADLRALETFQDEMRTGSPAIPDESVDVVVSNCVLNLVDPADKTRLFQEIYRVLRRGGRAVISDIVSDEPVPVELQNDPELWSGCISGAFQERQFIEQFESAGFHGIQISSFGKEPWQTVAGIEFRSATLIAYKGKEGPCFEHNEGVIYKGPFKKVEDDDGHVYERGERIAVCRKTCRLLSKAPYRDHFICVEPHTPVSDEEAKPFHCSSGAMRRDPTVTKGGSYSFTDGDDCGDDSCCC